MKASVTGQMIDANRAVQSDVALPRPVSLNSIALNVKNTKATQK